MTGEKPTTLEYLLPRATKAVCGKLTWSRRSTRSLWHPEKPKGSGVPIDTTTLLVRIREECGTHWQAGVWLHFDTWANPAACLTAAGVL